MQEEAWQEQERLSLSLILEAMIFCAGTAGGVAGAGGGAAGAQEAGAPGRAGVICNVIVGLE